MNAGMPSPKTQYIRNLLTPFDFVLTIVIVLQKTRN